MPEYPRLIWTAPDGVTTFDFNDAEQSLLVSRPRGFGLPPINHVSYPVPLRHGEVYVRSLMGARLIRIDVLFTAAGWAALAALNESFLSAVNMLANGSGALGTLQFQAHAAATTYAIDCLLTGPLDRRERGPTHQRLDIGFYCPTPQWRKAAATALEIVLAPSGVSVPISVPMSFSATQITQALANAGHLPAPPLVTFTGECEQPSITLVGSGQSVTFLGELADGDVLIVDMGQQTVTLNGQNRLYQLAPASQLFEIPAGGGEVVVATLGGGVTAAVSYHEQFLGVDF